MAVCFNQGDELTRGGLDLFLKNAGGNPTNAFSVTYSVYYVDAITCAEILIGTANRTPVNPAVGEYYAALQIPPTAKAGTYRIRWNIQESAGAPVQQVVQEFCIVDVAAAVSSTALSQCEQGMIDKLRFMIRDRNPDRNYRFRPPEGEGSIGCNNQVNGFIWEDEELLEFMEIALWKWNSFPPETESLHNINTLCTRKPTWRAAILWGGIVNAAMAMAFNWTADEFSLDGNTLVDVYPSGGEQLAIRMDELYGICQGGGSSMSVDTQTQNAIREAHHSGQLHVRAVDPSSGSVGLHVVSAVLEHDTPHKEMVRVTLEDGRATITTVDHSLFHRAECGIVPVEAGALQVGDSIATVVDGVVWVDVAALDRLPPEPTGKTYDLSVPGPENFLLSNGVLAHNSYSIGGISLDLERSSKYMDLKRNAEEQFTKLTDAKMMTTKFMKGLRQPRFGRGVRSAFGPNVGRGVLSPRNFVVVFLGIKAAFWLQAGVAITMV